MKVILHYPDSPTGPFDEEIEGERLTCGWVELSSHSTFCPLGPTDAVEVDDALRVVAVRALHHWWTVEATLHLPRGTTFALSPTDEHPAMKAVAETEEDWRRAAYVTRNTSFSFLVSSSSIGWLEENVEGHPYVEHVDVRRTPTMKADLKAWLSHPSFV